MKRILSNRNKQKKAEIRRLVMDQLRKMRKKMKREHPGMLENMREAIEKNKKAAVSEPVSEQPQSELNIDQSKNIEAVEKMLSLKENNPGFEKAVKAMLPKQD